MAPLTHSANNPVPLIILWFQTVSTVKTPFGILPELWHAICCSNGYQIREAAMRIKTLSELEKEHIRKVLKVTDWNIEKAALLLQITLPQLKRKIRVHGFHKELTS